MRVLCLLWLAGCGNVLSNGGFEIDCGDKPCDWTFVEGDAKGGPGWLDGDPALDLGAGHVVVEQHAAPVTIWTRELLLQAAIACDADASVRFELAWYEGATLVDTRPVEVDQYGVFALKTLVSTPSLAVDGLTFRIVKDGPGQAIVDEIKLEPYFQ